jgi:hypothetical protein
MQDMRRYALLAALTLGAGLALAGCRSDPAVAAYVGGDKITEAQVDHLVANAKALEQTPEPTASAPAQTQTSQLSRSSVVTVLVLGKVCAQLQAKQGFKPQPIGAERASQIGGVPPTSEFATELDKTYSCLSAIPISQSAQPTDAELHDIYDRAKVKGLVNVPFDQIKAQIAGDQTVQRAIAVNRVLDGMVTDGDVRVNPRYRPMEFTISDLGTGEPLIVLTMGEPASDAVHDAS